MPDSMQYRGGVDDTTHAHNGMHECYGKAWGGSAHARQLRRIDDLEGSTGPMTYGNS